MDPQNQKVEEPGLHESTSEAHPDFYVIFANEHPAAPCGNIISAVDTAIVPICFMTPPPSVVAVGIRTKSILVNGS